MRDCVRCPQSMHVSESEIQEQIDLVLASGVPITKPQQYQDRLKTCAKCNQFFYGTTCKHCGCLVRVRALNALRICPYPGGNKW